MRNIIPDSRQTSQSVRRSCGRESRERVHPSASPAPRHGLYRPGTGGGPGAGGLDSRPRTEPRARTAPDSANAHRPRQTAGVTSTDRRGRSYTRTGRRAGGLNGYGTADKDIRVASGTSPPSPTRRGIRGRHQPTARRDERRRRGPRPVPRPTHGAPEPIGISRSQRCTVWTYMPEGCGGTKHRGQQQGADHDDGAASPNAITAVRLLVVPRSSRGEQTSATQPVAGPGRASARLRWRPRTSRGTRRRARVRRTAGSPSRIRYRGHGSVSTMPLMLRAGSPSRSCLAPASRSWWIATGHVSSRPR